jgi:hypothetical protein
LQTKADPGPARHRRARCSARRCRVIISAEPPAISTKRAGAQAVLAQIRNLDSRVEKTIEAYNYASTKLAAIRRKLKVNTTELRVARHNLRRAQQLLGQRRDFGCDTGTL